MARPEYPLAVARLAEMIVRTIDEWQADHSDALTPTERNWRVAEAIHLVTWIRPHAYAPLCVLLDEDFTAAVASPGRHV